ncbi:BPSS1780 family membrane protein [Lysobacter sp. D1-1-M9]|uniref:BPSS1780 family membrane protein n=1 Tax=Novilysobacter longmucuonensis TaxID=3098603 RepID=UPI002FC58F73
MTQIHKVPFSAGAEWLLGGFRILRRAPLSLGLLGLIWGGLSALASATGQVWLSLIVAVLGPVLFGGIIYAAREVDQGRAALPMHLLQGPREGKLPRLLAMLLPQIAALVLLVLLLLALIGSDQLQQVTQVLQQMQTNPDPALASALPAARLLLWMLLAVLVGIVAGFFTFVAIPEVMFTQRGAFDAMAISFRACLRNLAALIVMIVLMFIAVLAISIAINIVVMLLGWAIGPQPALFIGQLLTMAVLMPVMAGTIYFAWRQLLGDAPAAPVVNEGFEA